MKEKLFAALLTHVPFDGWSDAALRRAAQDVEIDFSVAQELFPDALTMIDHHHRLTDAAMVIPEVGGVTARVRAAILSRLDFVEQDREAVRRAFHLLSLPQNLYAGTKMAYRSADAIWARLGSDDAGFDWVTKRSSLIAVYGATLLFWLSEKGRDRGAVETFLDRQLGRLLAVMRPISKMKTSLKSAFTRAHS